MKKTSIFLISAVVLIAFMSIVIAAQSSRITPCRLSSRPELCPPGSERTLDDDKDGVMNSKDLCPNTDLKVAGGVDKSGCSAWQFCGARDVENGKNLNACRYADWKMNEQKKQNSFDCTVEWNSNTNIYRCLPASTISRNREKLLAN